MSNSSSMITKMTTVHKPLNTYTLRCDRLDAYTERTIDTRNSVVIRVMHENENENEKGSSVRNE